VRENALARSLALDCPQWTGHLAGQFMEVRRTAGGAPASRAWIASAPGEAPLTVTVERILADLRPGDRLELRGPAGSFVWHPALGGPLLLIAAGLGIVPSRAILRHRTRSARELPARLLYEATSLRAVPFRDDLARLAAFGEVDVRLMLTAERSSRWRGDRTPVDAAVVRDAAWDAAERPLVYVLALGLAATRMHLAATEPGAPRRRGAAGC
jgi:ferredoxin-NADP reductase